MSGKTLSSVADATSVQGRVTPLPDLKGKLTEGLRELPRRILVIIDDLDRLEPQEAAEVMRLIRVKTVESWFYAPILQKLRTHRNKFIAHAADEFSRRIEPLDRLGLSLDEIAEAQRIVIRIATTIGSNILYDTALGGVVPTPQFNVFENLEMPVIPAANMEEIADWWHRHERERDNWLQERIDLITGQITPIT